VKNGTIVSPTRAESTAESDDVCTFSILYQIISSYKQRKRLQKRREVNARGITASPTHKREHNRKND
jgi:hypothetical protein